MAKPVKALLKLQITGGGATPAPPVGSALGQYGVNIMDFVQAFNNDTASRQGETVPVEITIYEDCLLYTSPSPRDQRGSRMPSSA